MKVAIFGATGLLGRECLSQCLEADHDVTVLLRTPSKLPAELREQVTVVEGDGLDPEAVERALASRPDGILFAVGIDGMSDRTSRGGIYRARCHRPGSRRPGSCP